MLRTVSRRVPRYCRHYATGYIPSAAKSESKVVRHALIAAPLVLTGGCVYYALDANVLQSDAPGLPFDEGSSTSKTLLTSTSLGSGLVQQIDEQEHLVSTVWGSNRGNVLLYEPTSPSSVRAPTQAPWLTDVALRDLALGEQRAACVDARGDVYQWGLTPPSSKPQAEDERFAPRATLKGMDITALQLAGTRLYALSASGKVYSLPADPDEQGLPIGGPSTSSWGFGWFSGETTTTRYTELTPDSTLSWGEKFTSISAGQDHLLALTSSGRTFAHPISLQANSHGQLGVREVEMTTGDGRVPMSLLPRSSKDPYAKTKPVERMTIGRPDLTAPAAAADERDTRFCETLYEIPSLKGINIAQAVAGGRHSFVRTPDGRVLGWGANEYGQVGLGGAVTLDVITRPTEVVLSRGAARTSRTRCIDIAAAGDLSLFTSESVDGTSLTTVDVQSCGNGQWGGLGNGLYSNAQSSPVRVRSVSGLLEYNEATKALEPIVPHAISASPSGHVLCTLDTHARSGPGGGGRDLLAWGANFDYQLGNGKKGSVAKPFQLQKAQASAVPMLSTAESVAGMDRFMLMKRKAAVVKDMQGKTWKKGVEVEQVAVAGAGASFVYWRIC